MVEFYYRLIQNADWSNVNLSNLNVSKNAKTTEMNSEDKEDFIIDEDAEGMVYVNDAKVVSDSLEF